MDDPIALGPLKRANGKSLDNNGDTVDDAEKLTERALEVFA